MAAGPTGTRRPLPEFDEPPKLLVVVAPYVEAVTNLLCEGAQRLIEQANGASETVSVPGALEIPPAINLAARSERFEGFVALGCVMRGETTHYETVCEESARGLTILGLSGLCIGNGILTVENMDQATERADPARQDKGGDAAEAALRLIELSRRFVPSGGRVGFSLPKSSLLQL